MDEVQEKFERVVANQFIDWYNSSHNSTFKIVSKSESPDFYISDGSIEYGLEITSVYYDDNYAKLLWQPARNIENAPTRWGGMDIDDKLIKNIFSCIESKSLKGYGSNCILLIYTRPGLTYFEELAELIKLKGVLPLNPFKGIYVVGSFPLSSTGSGGEHVLCLS